MLRFYRAGDDHIVQLKLLENGSVVRSTSVRVDSESDAPELVCRRLVQVVVDGKSKSEITQVGTLLESDQNDKALQRVLPARSAFGLAIGPTAILERKAVSLKGNLTNFSFHLDEANLGMVIEASFLTGERGYDATSLNFGLQKYFSRHTHSLFAGGSMGGVIWDNDSHVDTMSHKANEGMYHHVGEEHRGYSLTGWFGGEVGRLSTMSLLGMARVTVLQEFRTGSKTLVLPGVFVGIKIRRVP
jgi:hypothetical protein